MISFHTAYTKDLEGKDLTEQEKRLLASPELRSRYNLAVEAQGFFEEDTPKLLGGDGRRTSSGSQDASPDFSPYVVSGRPIQFGKPIVDIDLQHLERCVLF